MVNTADFVKRLEKVLQYYAISASVFADKIGVQRSSISHLLSGRNKPSLDLILKIIENFPEVDLYWILNGKGIFPKLAEIKPPTPILEKKTATLEMNFPAESNLFNSAVQPKQVATENYEKNPLHNEDILNTNPNLIEKIVFFYKDGSFKIYSPK